MYMYGKIHTCTHTYMYMYGKIHIRTVKIRVLLCTCPCTRVIENILPQFVKLFKVMSVNHGTPFR